MIAKRKIVHLLEVTRTLLFQTFVSRSYWKEAVLIATNFINILPSGSRGYYSCSAYDHILSFHSRVFGCPTFVYVHSPYQGKLDPHAMKCVFISYAPNKKWYKCYHSQSRKVYVSKDVTFHETKSFFPSSQLQGKVFKKLRSLSCHLFLCCKISLLGRMTKILH